MKRLSLLITLIFTIVIVAEAQSFKLWYANNVTDVANLDDIESEGSGLNWREVDSNTQTVAGNLVEVSKLKQMLSSTRMKGLEDKRQFWRMRDHGLLCFKIEDLDNVNHTYEVFVSNGADTISQTVDDFFFVNAPVPQDTVAYDISVRRVDNDETVRFKYYVYEWGNENLYMFMLDQKRQVTGETYKLEYVTGYMDEDGDLYKTSNTLELQSDKFQSFYVPQGSDLLDVFLLSGDDKKLRLNKSKLHTGIDLNDRMSFMEISSTFNLDKHEGREMMNFNWLGTGLYEKYDTLYISLFNDKGKYIKNATIHPERVDHEGNRINDASVRYAGYDNKTKQHRVVTMSNPAYIEILVDDYLPMLYKYPGAFDEEGIVNPELCQVALTPQKGTVSSGFNISDQHFLNLHDNRAIIVRNGTDHRLCSIDAVDLSGRVEADTISYMDDLGNNFPKLLNNKVVEHYAQFETSFSIAKGGSAPDCELIATDIETNISKEATEKNTTVVRASEFTSFQYDYYFVRFNLLDVIDKGTTAKVALRVGAKQYAGFPYLRNLDFNREEVEKDAAEEINDNYVGDNDSEGAARGFADAGYDLKLPFQFKFSFKPVSLNTAFVYDIRKNLYSLKINVALNRGDENGEVPEEDEKYSKARKELIELEKYENFNINDKTEASGLGDEVSFDDWIYDEIDDIFDISSRRIGRGWFGGAKLSFNMPPFDFKHFQVTEAAGQLGYGVGMRWNAAENERFKKLAAVLDKVSDYISLSACFELSMQADFGIKSFQDGVSESMSSTNMGYFFDFSGKLSAGASLDLFTPEELWGFKLSAIANIQAGLRLGAKAGFRFGVEGPFDRYVPGVGAAFIGVIVGQAYLNVKTPIFYWSGSAGFQLGGRLLVPDNNHNPFHNDFPYWLNDAEAKPVALAYHRIPAPETTEISGKAIINDVAPDANPHFFDSDQIVYNDLGAADNYNDDKVIVANFANDEMTKEVISTDGLFAGNHMHSKRGEYEIIVFEQLSQPIGDVDEEHVVSQNSEVQQTTRIRTAMRKGTGNWTVADVTPDDGWADLKPIVTMQENGHAALIYQHGKFDVVDPNESADSLSNIQFKGNLMLRTFDGTSWSEPTVLYDFDLDKDHVIQNYDLLMRGDTTLVAATLLETGKKSVMRYASKYISNNTVNYYDESLKALSFHMKRVGKNAVVAMIYAASDSISDIYVKTIDMTGRGDGRQGNDLGVGYNLPSKVKIVTDSNAEDLNNFVVMWTQMSSVYHGDEGEKKFSKNSTMMLQASRIFVSNALQITDPITLGAEMVDKVGDEERNLIITSFDGFLDDAKISAVYTLADVKENGAVIMRNDKYFRNSYEWDVSYGSASLLGSSTLPVAVKIKNTGTSAINGVTAIINGESHVIEGAYVKPYDTKEFVVLYPINDDFDGHISSQVIVDYLNTFQAQAHPRNKAKSFRRQASTAKNTRVTMEDVECNVVSHSIENGKNIILVELTDHANLKKDMTAFVGVYPHPDSFEALDNAKYVVFAENEEYGISEENGYYKFHTIGGKRKAYVPIEVNGITEPIQAYVNCHLVDWNYAEEGLETMMAAVKNVRAQENPTLINLFPSEDPTSFVRPVISDDPTGHKVTVTILDNGVRLDGLTADNTVRVFAADGMTAFKKEATGTTMFVPLSRHDVYLLSTGEEIFKFRF